MTPMLHFHHADVAQDLAHALARFVAARLTEALNERGQALLIVSGGRSPVPFFEALATMPLDWAHVAITLADERWLGPDHADSNERLVRSHLMKGAASRARWVPLYNGAPTPQAGRDAAEEALNALPWPAAVTVLGMGGDGHTASLFPHDAAWLAASQDAASRCLAVQPPSLPNVPVSRMSLSPQALLETQQLVLHLTGHEKAAVLQQALQPGAAADLPVRLVLQQQRVPCDVFQSP